MRILGVLLITLLLAGCATSSHSTRSRAIAQPAYPPMVIRDSDIEPSSIASAITAYLPAVGAVGAKHTVRAGETLWAISKMYRVDVAILAETNSINDSRSIEVGQVLTIPGAASVKGVKSSANYGAARAATFIWPVNGCIEIPFGAKIDKVVNKGIGISASEGTSVIASREGKVVYCDPYLKGFGQTVIIDHLDGFQTVYSYNSDILVNAGDMVRQRDVIARVGSSGRAKKPMLHFEIRKNGVPQNPEFYLSRSR